MSNYNHDLSIYRAKGMLFDFDFNRALETYPHYFASSLYFQQLSPYLKNFGSEKILLLRLDDLKSNPRDVMRSIFEFLNLPDAHIDASKVYDHRNNEPPLVEKSRFKFKQKHYDRILAPIVNDIDALERVSGRSFSEWDLSAEKWCL